mgnify:CR=1 FL=1
MSAITTKNIMTLEHHCLRTRYQHLRLHKQGALEKLATSIQTHGQLVPVVLVPESLNQWVLIDGHLRVQAFKRLGKDTVEVEVWECDTTEALLMVLKSHSSRTLEVLEEALLLQELHVQHNLSQNELATRVGRDKSWISRRLSVLECISNNVLNALLSNAISLWSVMRVLAPLARANSNHSEKLLIYLLKHFRTTRELQLFYHHYDKSNHKISLQNFNKITKTYQNPPLSIFHVYTFDRLILFAI